MLPISRTYCTAAALPISERTLPACSTFFLRSLFASAFHWWPLPEEFTAQSFIGHKAPTTTKR